jgi:RimJ/RimL family protein N-acetyltransferase
MLKGSKITLRAIKPEDLVQLNYWRNDLRNKILVQGFRLPVTLDMDETWYNEKTAGKDDKNIYFIIESNMSNKTIGLIQLNNIDYISGTAIWGFIIGEKSERGKGHEVEAPLLLLNYAFNVLNLRKLVSYTLNIRPGIQKLHNKVGKVRVEGVLKEHYFFNGAFYDVHILSFFREDFQNLKYDSSIF